MEERRGKKLLEKRLLIVSKIDTELAVVPDEEIVAKFFAYVRGALHTFVEHPIGEEKPSYLTAINYVLYVGSSSKMNSHQKEIFKNKWLKFKKHISEFARVDGKILEEKNLAILSALEKEKIPNLEKIISLIRETLPSKFGDIWKETQEFEYFLSNREWKRACSLSEGTGRSPWLFLD